MSQGGSAAETPGAQAGDAAQAVCVVQIVGTPVACSQGVKDTWRDIAAWSAEQLQRRFGEVVRVEYYDLFDPACPEIPAVAQLPFVTVSGEVLSSGGKISVPAIRKRLEALGIPPA